jgi:hypothetical protein
MTYGEKVLTETDGGDLMAKSHYDRMGERRAGGSTIENLWKCENQANEFLNK